MNKPFKRLKKSNIFEEIKEFALKDNYNQIHFIQKQIPKELFLKDSFLNQIDDQFPLTGNILKIKENHFVNWHVDSSYKKRNVCINMLLHHTRSYCLFNTGSNNETFPFLHLKYEPQTYYLLNVTIPHAIANFDEDRLLLNLSPVDENITYEELSYFIDSIPEDFFDPLPTEE